MQKSKQPAINILNQNTMLDSTQILKLKMYSEILELCDTNARHINFSSEFNISLSVFKMKIADINEMIELAAIAKKKYDERKDTSKRRLCNVTSEIKAMLNGEFTCFSQKALKLKIVDCFSELYLSDDHALELKINSICEEAHSRLDDLIKFGITAPLIEVLKEMLLEYQDTFYEKNYEAVNKTIVYNVKNLFSEAEYVLKKQLDRHVNRLKKNNSAFIMEYKEARLLKYQSTQVA